MKENKTIKEIEKLTKEEVKSIFASCNVKIFMKLADKEDVEKTRKLFEKQK